MFSCRICSRYSVKLIVKQCALGTTYGWVLQGSILKMLMCAVHRVVEFELQVSETVERLDETSRVDSGTMYS